MGGWEEAMNLRARLHKTVGSRSTRDLDLTSPEELRARKSPPSRERRARTPLAMLQPTCTGGMASWFVGLLHGALDLVCARAVARAIK